MHLTIFDSLACCTVFHLFPYASGDFPVTKYIFKVKRHLMSEQKGKTKHTPSRIALKSLIRFCLFLFYSVHPTWIFIICSVRKSES